MSDSKTASNASIIQIAVLKQLNDIPADQTFSTDALPDGLATVAIEKLTGPLKSLEASQLVTLTGRVENYPELNKLGQDTLEKGSPAMRVLLAVLADQGKEQKDKKSKKELSAIVKGGFGAAMSKKLIAINGTGGIDAVADADFEDLEVSELSAFISGADAWRQLDAKAFATKKTKDPDTKKVKKYLQWAKRTVWVVGRGPQFSTGV
jgi:hypothetical protein